MKSSATHGLRALAASALLLACVAPAQALDLKRLDIDQVISNNEYPAIRVKFNREADNWTDVSTQQVDVRIRWELEVVAVYALRPPSKVSIHMDTMFAEQLLSSTNNNLTELHLGEVRLRRAGNDLVEIKAKALEICNLIRVNRGKPNKEHRIVRLFKASAFASAFTTAPVFTEEMASKEKLIRVDVICEEDPGWREPREPATTNLSADLGDFRVIKAELFLTTFQNQFTQASPGIQCKKLQVKIRIETNKPGFMSYTLWRQPGEKETGSSYFERLTDGPFKGRSVLERTFWVTFDKTTYVNYMLEAGGFPRGKSTPWKDIQISCTGVGGGGLAAAPVPGSGSAADELPSFAVIDSNVQLHRLPGNQCPARVKVIASYRTNIKGSFEHFVGCSNGVNHKGMLAAHDAISSTNFGVRREYIVEMAQSGELICSARAVQFPKQLALRKLAVQCLGEAQDKLRAPTTPPPLRKKRD